MARSTGARSADPINTLRRQPDGLPIGLPDTADVGSRQGMVEGVALNVGQRRRAVVDHGAEEIEEGEEGKLGLYFDTRTAQHRVAAS